MVAVHLTALNIFNSTINQQLEHGKKRREFEANHLCNTSAQK
jgi:hypothetical protein